MWRKNYLYWISPKVKKAVNWKWLKYYWRIFLTNYTFFKTIQVLKSPRRCLTSYLKNSLTVNFSSLIFDRFVWIPYLSLYINDTHREQLVFHSIQYREAGWLLLIFFICLHSQLSSTHSITSTDVWKMWFIKQTVKMDGCSFQQVYGKIWVSFCLNTGKRFFLEVSFSSQQKKHRFF